MDIEASASLTATPSAVFDEVADLATYPDWLGIVFAADPSTPQPGDGGPAWMVELGARLGPLPLTKRLRMVRTQHVPPTQVRFERRDEGDTGHSAWILTAEVAAADRGSVLKVHLHYGGAGRVPGVDAILAEEIRKGGGRLQRRLDASAR